MNSDQISLLLERVNRQASPKSKIALLKEHDCSQLRAVLKAALDPFIRYNLTWEEPITCGVGRLGGDAVFDLADPRDPYAGRLRELQSRQLSGGKARQAFADCLSQLNLASAHLLARIINKDLRCGVGITLANRAFPGLVPTFDVMLAHPFEAKRVKRWPAAVEPKLDGIRVAVLISPGGEAEHVQFLTRNGLPVTSLEHLRAPVFELARQWAYTLREEGVFLDCEVVSGESFYATSGAARRKSEQAEDAVLHVFDYLPLTEFQDAGFMVYSTRRRELESAFGALGERRCPAIRLVPCLRAYSEEHVHQYYDEFRTLGYEGAIVKVLDGVYEKKRSHAFMKLKARETVDAPIMGVEEGAGKYAGQLGAVLVPGGRGTLVSVGSGFTDEQRRTLWQERCSLPGRLIEVAYHEQTPDGSLRHPRFVRFRDAAARIGDKI